MVGPAGPVGVEVLRLHALGHQVPAGVGVLGERPGGGDVVGGDGVTQLGEAPGAVDAPDLGLLEDVVEERGVADVGGVLVPGEQRGVLAGDGVPPG